MYLASHIHHETHKGRRQERNHGRRDERKQKDRSGVQGLNSRANFVSSECKDIGI
jgi:hypothetical protein